MRRSRRGVKKGQSSQWAFMDEFAEFEPDPVRVELYRIRPRGERRFLGTLAWYERTLGDIMDRFGGGVYQVVARYRRELRVTPVFEIEGPPIDETT